MASEDVNAEVASEAKTKSINQLSEDAFTKVGEYLRGELLVTCEEYKLLEQMNRTTLARYTDLKQTATGINYALQEINDKFRLLRPYLEQIDDIDDQVTLLEQTANKLDAYSKRLEARYKQLEKR